jgi:pyruvate/2-oxoglutarate dehydrogenase complex dihydrolipoamide dehydrogenase (E3) component
MIYDVCVIGAGSGGLTTAAFCASLGAKVILIEKHKMGGDCLNYGCVPSKALLHAAKHMNFAAAMAHVKAAIQTIEPNDSNARFEGLGVEVMIGEAKFTSKTTIKVENREITARKFVIATGSRANSLGVDSHLTNETIFDLKMLPKTLGIIGGGVIAVEMAQAFAMMGAKVTIHVRSRLLPRENDDVADIIRQSLSEKGVIILENTQECASFEQILNATGRVPNIALDLELAGVHYTEKGIIIDHALKTSNKNIYAIGDVVGGGYTHAAGYHGSLVSQNILFKRPINHMNSAMPRVIYTNPEVAIVGETTGHRVLFAALTHNDRAITDQKTNGFVKLHITPKGKIKGAEIVCEGAGEMISLYSLAINKGLGIGDIAATIMPYPTLSEAGKRAAGEFYKSSASNPWVRRLVSILKRF